MLMSERMASLHMERANHHTPCSKKGQSDEVCEAFLEPSDQDRVNLAAWSKIIRFEDLFIAQI